MNMNLYDFKMFDRYEQVDMYSPAEFERRWELTRKVMRDNDCGALVVFNASYEGYDQWLTGVRNIEYAILMADGGAVAVMSDRIGDSGDTRVWDLSRKKVYPVHCDIKTQESFDFENLSRALTRLGQKRIAAVNPDAMSADFADALKKSIPQTEIIDVTLTLSVERAVKSTEEIQAIRRANLAHEKAMLAMKYYLRQGRTFTEVSNDVMRVLSDQGSGNGLMHAFLMNVGKQDEPGDITAFMKAPGRVFEYGDRLMVLMETNGYGGHCTAIGRFFSIGEPSRSFSEHVDICMRAQNFATSQMKPGTKLTQIVKNTRGFIEGNGYETNDQCFMHGMGYHMYEQFSVNDITEDIPLKKNCFLHAHPVIKRRYAGFDGFEPMHYLDAYLVGENGGVITNSLPRELFVVE